MKLFLNRARRILAKSNLTLVEIGINIEISIFLFCDEWNEMKQIYLNHGPWSVSFFCRVFLIIIIFISLGPCLRVLRVLRGVRWASTKVDKQRDSNNASSNDMGNSAPKQPRMGLDPLRFSCNSLRLLVLSSKDVIQISFEKYRFSFELWGFEFFDIFKPCTSTWF